MSSATTVREEALKLAHLLAYDIAMNISAVHSTRLRERANEVWIACDKALARSERANVPADAWLIERADGTKTVVLSPLTDDTYMDEGDEAWPLFKNNRESAQRVAQHGATKGEGHTVRSSSDTLRGDKPRSDALSLLKDCQHFLFWKCGPFNENPDAKALWERTVEVLDPSRVTSPQEGK